MKYLKDKFNHIMFKIFKEQNIKRFKKILALMIGAKYILKTVDGNSKQIVIHARIFTTIFFNLFAFNVLRHSCKADKCQRNDVCYSADNKRNV